MYPKMLFERKPKEVPATMGLVLTRDRKILLMKQRDNIRQKPYWTLPGGRCRFGEHSNQALATLAAAQTDFPVTGVTFLATLESLYGLHGRRKHEVMLLFTGRFEAAEPQAQDSWLGRKGDDGDLAEFQWVGLDETEALDGPVYPLGLLETLTQHEDKVFPV